LEAMSAGVPVVTTNTGGLPEINIHGETGFLEKVGDVEAMSSDILKIFSDSSLQKQLGNNARKRTLENFGTDRIVNQYVNYYEQVLAGKNI